MDQKLDYNDQLLDIIYELQLVPQYPSHWKAVLEMLAERVRNGKGVITSRSNITGHIDVENFLQTKTAGFDEDYVNAYIEGGYLLEKWTPIEWDHKVGQLCVFSDHLSFDKLEKSQYYQEWLKPQGITDGIAIQLFSNDHFRIVFNILYDDHSDAVTQLHKDVRILTKYMCRATDLWMHQVGLDKNASYVGRERYLSEKFDLTPREIEVVNALGRYQTTEKVAKKLGISENTVKTHRSRIFSKMGVDSVAKLILRLVSYVD